MINELAKQVYENAVEKGFYEKEKNIGEMLALIHSEVSEALEADRNNKCAVSNEVINTILEHGDNDEFKFDYKHFAKGSFEEEMADIVIRVLDMCGWKGIDLEAHIKAKMRYNSLREKYHGKKY